MAFPAFTISAGYAGASVQRDKSQEILGRIVWQEAPASGVASSNVAPPISDVQGQAVVRVRAAVDSWLSYGKIPNSATAVRVAVPANTDVDVYPEPGDRLMWQAA